MMVFIATAEAGQVCRNAYDRMGSLNFIRIRAISNLEELLNRADNDGSDPCSGDILAADETHRVATYRLNARWILFQRACYADPVHHMHPDIIEERLYGRPKPFYEGTSFTDNCPRR